MRATALRLVQVIPKSALSAEVKIIPRPTQQFLDLQKPTTLDILLQQKEAAGDAWPSNIRIEPVVKKIAFKDVEPTLRKAMKKLLRET